MQMVTEGFSHMLFSSASQRHFTEALLCFVAWFWSELLPNTDSSGCVWKNSVSSTRHEAHRLMMTFPVITRHKLPAHTRNTVKHGDCFFTE